MPQNPFGKDDPLAAGGASGGGAWGAAGQGAAGFGASTAADQSYGDEYDVVEISEDQPAAPAPKGKSKPSFGTNAQGASDIAAREAALAKREQEVRRREAAIASRGAAGIDPMMIKNFPPCCPVVHHDINNDIPQYNKNITRAGFFIFMGTCITLMYNFFCTLMAVIVAKSAEDSVSAWFFAALYMVLGIPGAWYTWYGRLYRAMMTDGAISFAAFFFSFLVHTAFCVWSAIAPDLAGANFSHAGWLTAIDLTKGDGGGDKLVSIFYFVGAGLWSALSFFSVTYMARVYNNMRGRDYASKARNEIYAGAAQYAADDAVRRAQGGQV